jgi:S1-C subfamily serine protease
MRDGSALAPIDPTQFVRGFVRASETYSSGEVQQTINRASASVVRIHATLEERVQFPVANMHRRPGRSFGRVESMEVGDPAAGSGFVISGHGEVVTNAHVAAPLGAPASLTVESGDGREFPAEIVGLDLASDLALLKIDTASIAPLPWADERRLHLGEETWAIGNPLDIGISATRGTISSVGRMRMGMNQVESYVHSDAFIAPGSSGGPLLNVLGGVVGVSAVGFREEKGQGYSIPSTMARLVIERLRRGGAYRRGVVGLPVSPINPELRKEYSIKRARGLVVLSILEGSPAAEAGVRKGDVLFGVNGRFAPSGYLMQEAISVAGPGVETRVTVDRSGTVLDISLTTTLRPEHPRIDPILHFEKLLSASFEEHPEKDGIVVRAPDRYSIARQYGLRDQAHFLEVIPAQDWPGREGKKRSSRKGSTRTKVSNLDELREALRRAYMGQRVGVTFILRMDRDRGATVALDEIWPIIL